MNNKKYLNQKLLSLIFLIVSFLIFLSVNVLVNNYFSTASFDLTKNKLYTFSEGTKKIIAGIDEPITFELYFSKKLAQRNPFLKGFGKRVEDLLKQYAKFSHGKIILKIKEPLPFTELEDEAVSRGLRGIQVDAEGSELFFGIIASNTLADEQTIPLVRPEREANLEYDLSQMVYSLSQNKLPIIGIISTLPIEGDNKLRVIDAATKPRSNPWIILDQIQQSFNLEMLDQKIDKIPDNIDTLMLVNPTSLSKITVQAIDEFAMRGGHILAFIDPYCDSMNNSAIKIEYDKSNDEDLAPLLAGWGIEIDQHVVASARDAQVVRWHVDNHDQAVRYALWLDLNKKNFASNDILTNTLDRLIMATPGAIKIIESSPAKVTALISTDEDAMLVNPNDIEKYHKDPRELLINYQPTGKAILAARITGTIKSPYSGKTAENANIIVVADTDLLYDHFWINFQNIMGQKVAVPQASNGNFVVSALENLAGSNALISIRNRATFDKPFTKIKQITNDAHEQFRVKEAQLVKKLEETKQQLNDYDNKLQDTASQNINEYRQERDAFRQEFLNVRKELREVRHRLTQSLESLEFKIKFFSIALMPIIVTLLGTVLWLTQFRRKAY